MDYCFITGRIPSRTPSPNPPSTYQCKLLIIVYKFKTHKKGLILVVHVVLVVTTVCRRTGRNYTCYKLPILHLHPLIPIYNYCWQRNKVWTQATHAAATSKMWELGLVLVLELGSVRAWARLIGWQRRPSLGRGRCRSLGWCRCGSMGR